LIGRVVCPKGIGVWQSFGRGKTKGRRCKNNVSKQKGVKIETKIFFLISEKNRIAKKTSGPCIELRVARTAGVPRSQMPLHQWAL